MHEIFKLEISPPTQNFYNITKLTFVVDSI